MGRRHPGPKFMPGKFVFPGGRIEAGDRRMPVAGALHPRAEAGAHGARSTRPSTQRGRALALAAIRETYRGDRPAARHQGHGRAGGACRTALDGVSGRAASSRTSRRCISSPAPSPRPGASAALRHPLLRRSTARASPTRSRAVAGPECELVELAWVTLAEAREARPAPHHPRDAGGARPIASPSGFGHELPVPFYSLPPRPLRARAVVTFALSGCRRFRPPLRPLAPASTAKESPPSRPRSPA